MTDEIKEGAAIAGIGGNNANGRSCENCNAVNALGGQTTHLAPQASTGIDPQMRTR